MIWVGVQAKFDAAKMEKQRLQDDADLTKKRMESATALIDGLSGERQRWTQQAKEFEDEIQRLTGDCAMSAAFMTYCGGLNREYRQLMSSSVFLKDCLDRKVPVTRDLDFVKFLTDGTEIGEWNLEGLPTDDLSIQNAILATRSSRCVLLVDPQAQGRKWMLNHEEKNGLKLVQFSDKTLIIIIIIIIVIIIILNRCQACAVFRQNIPCVAGNGDHRWQVSADRERGRDGR